MQKEKLNAICKEAYEQGEDDTYTEDKLMESAVLFLNNEANIPEDTTLEDEEQNEILEAYRDGFLGRPLRTRAIPDNQPKNIVISLYEASDEGYMYDIWLDKDPEDCTGDSDDGGQCTSDDLKIAVEMAYGHAQTLLDHKETGI